jgi:hypothetical protein
MLDERTALDGTRSVRFYATERTRVFQNVVQEVPIQPGVLTRLRVQHKTENVRVEFQQRRADFKVQITFLSHGTPVGEPAVVQGRLGSHAWELLAIEQKTPANATEARIELMCSLSGTAWFDGLVFEVIDDDQQW